MIATWRDEYGTRALKLVTLLLIASFALIPVRCDASTAPHSIFTDPMAVAASSDIQSNDVPVASHHHQHHPGMQMASTTTGVGDTKPSAEEELCSISMTAGTDLHSQQPVGAALDLPTTPVPPVASALLPLEGELVVIVNPSIVVLTGIAAPPEAPPPKFA